ncbi:Hypothetical protein ACI5QL_00268 [Bacillus velezensis]
MEVHTRFIYVRPSYFNRKPFSFAMFRTVSISLCFVTSFPHFPYLLTQSFA